MRMFGIAKDDELKMLSALPKEPAPDVGKNDVRLGDWSKVFK